MLQEKEENMRFGGFSELGSSSIEHVEKIRETSVPLELDIQRMLREQQELMELQMNSIHNELFGTLPKSPESERIVKEALKDKRFMNTYTEKQLAEALHYETGIEECTDDILKWKHRAIERLNPSKEFKEIVEIQEVNLHKVKTEAKKRIANERAAAVKAKKAQTFYNSISDSTCGKSAEKSAEAFKENFQKAIEKEAKERTLNETLATQKAADAQKYYNSISDKTWGKSAKKSAEAFEEHFKEVAKKEAETRTLNQTLAAKRAQSAQNYYNSLSNSTCGKLAEESADTFKEHFQEVAKKEAKQRTLNKTLAAQRAQNAQTYYSSISNATCGKSAKESANALEKCLEEIDSQKIKDVIGENNPTEEIQETVKKSGFTEKIGKAFKNNKVKYTALIGALLLAGGIIISKIKGEKDNSEK